MYLINYELGFMQWLSIGNKISAWCKTKYIGMDYMKLKEKENKLFFSVQG